MSLGQNLQFLRKRDNITQEQLAEVLEVSRQSVSKWESDTTYPEMEKLLQLANLFHCSLDDLVQKDISTQYVEDKCNYDQFMNQFSKRITAGVGLILSGLTLMMFLCTFCSADTWFRYGRAFRHYFSFLCRNCRRNFYCFRLTEKLF